MFFVLFYGSQSYRCTLQPNREGRVILLCQKKLFKLPEMVKNLVEMVFWFPPPPPQQK